MLAILSTVERCFPIGVTHSKGDKGRELPRTDGLPESLLSEWPVSLAISCELVQKKQRLWMGGITTNSFSSWPLNNNPASPEHPSKMTPALLPARLPQSNLCVLSAAFFKLLPHHLGETEACHHHAEHQMKKR